MGGKQSKTAPSAKISRPRLRKVYARARLFQRLDELRSCPAIWIEGLAGSGKTTLIASYLDARELPCLWYQVDERDADIASPTNTRWCQ
jgi:LuxR family transcriptional regulator, maltose regulon positive regulatory protein